MIFWGAWGRFMGPSNLGLQLRWLQAEAFVFGGSSSPGACYLSRLRGCRSPKLRVGSGGVAWHWNTFGRPCGSIGACKDRWKFWPFTSLHSFLYIHIHTYTQFFEIPTFLCNDLWAGMHVELAFLRMSKNQKCASIFIVTGEGRSRWWWMQDDGGQNACGTFGVSSWSSRAAEGDVDVSTSQGTSLPD